MFKNKSLQKNSSYYQNGFTLIEILIALLIGAFLIAGLFQIFLSTKQAYKMQENLSRLQENGRFAMLFISKDLRKAGYRECVTNPAISNGIEGTNGVATSTSTPDVPDTITIIESISVCGAVATTRTTTYSIQTGSGGEPALFKQENGAASTEVVEDVENMQIIYGEDTNGDRTPNYYVPFGSVVSMSKVVSIRISLLLRTEEEVADSILTYFYNGKNNTPTDRRIRRVFNSTLTVRNRVP